MWEDGSGRADPEPANLRAKATRIMQQLWSNQGNCSVVEHTHTQHFILFFLLKTKSCWDLPETHTGKQQELISNATFKAVCVCIYFPFYTTLQAKMKFQIKSPGTTLSELPRLQPKKLLKELCTFFFFLLTAKPQTEELHIICCINP